MTDTFDKAISHHQDLAAGWDARYLSGSFARRARFFRDSVRPMLEPNGRWLDAGCGSGYFARILAEFGAVVHGIDGASDMVQAARSAARDHPAANRLSFELVETIERLPFEDASFDGVLSLSVLEYVPDPQQALAEMARVLRPGGQLVVSIPNTGSLIRALAALRQRLRRQSAGGSAYLESSHFTVRQVEIAPMLSRHGMALQSVHPCDPSLHGLLARISPNLYFITARRA
ncbi:MAG: class I SAM-dependent methyltransferase [Pseudomonadota bacterium]